MRAGVWRAVTAVALLVAGVGLAAGCRSRPAPAVPVRPTYDGPLLTVEQVVAELAERAGAVRTVWARHDYVVRLLERTRTGERVRTFDGDGVLLLRKPPAGSAAPTPMELRLQGSKDVLGTVFDLGSNRERAWLVLYADIDTMYWTTLGDADTFDADEGAGDSVDPARMPARPELLAEVLGVSDWSTDLTRYPTPVMRYESDADAYVLTLVEPAPTGLHLIGRREYWVDRGTLEVRRVVLRGRDGREVVRSELADYGEVEDVRGGRAASGGSGGTGRLARDITVAFPQSGTTIRLTLRSVSARRGALPSDASFRFPDPPPVQRVVRVR